jgi:ArsR family transcriptional regulator, arsenate/arsenite/antimonite-responsive transcriptional repressor
MTDQHTFVSADQIDRDPFMDTQTRGHIMDSANIERISKALANETRLRIFEAISRNKEMTSSTIVTLRRVAAATVSHHLKILSHAGLIECRRQGQFVHNRAVPETIEDYARALLTISQGKGWWNKRETMDKQSLDLFVSRSRSGRIVGNPSVTRPNGQRRVRCG